jgi:DNA modification methylase
MPATKKKSDIVLSRAHPDSAVTAAVRIGDCREQLPKFDAVRTSSVDLVFADPPFNWARDYDRHETGNAWDDASMSREEYLAFTEQWLDLCVDALAPHGSMWVNIPDDSAAEIVVHLKKREMHMVNWCVWHYRFGQNTKGRFINSKVHALYFCKDPKNRTWNPDPVLEESDRRAIYGDKRTESKKDGLPAGMRVPMDVWYGKHWGRIQGNNKERRPKHDNQLPETYLHRVIACSSNPRDMVLDPFLGSGTTGVVAHAMERNFIATEFSKENAEMAFDRIAKGPVRDLGTIRGESTAIHPKRAGSSGAESPE